MAERPEDLNLPNAVITRIIKEAVGAGRGAAGGQADGQTDGQTDTHTHTQTDTRTARPPPPGLPVPRVCRPKARGGPALSGRGQRPRPAWAGAFPTSVT